MDIKREVNTSIKSRESEGERDPKRRIKSYKREKGKNTMLLGRCPRT